jgi:hypothetical protein
MRAITRALITCGLGDVPELLPRFGCFVVKGCHLGVVACVLGKLGARATECAVRFRDRSRAQHLVIYLTHDGGASWSARPAAHLRAQSPGTPTR